MNTPSKEEFDTECYRAYNLNPFDEGTNLASLFEVILTDVRAEDFALYGGKTAEQLAGFAEEEARQQDSYGEGY